MSKPKVISHIIDTTPHVTLVNKNTWDKKVDPVINKGLSENDYTTAEKTKLSGLKNTTVNNTLSSTSTTDALSANQGKVLSEKVDSKADKTDLNTLSDSVNTITRGLEPINESIKNLNLELIATNAEVDMKANYVWDKEITFLANGWVANGESFKQTVAIAGVYADHGSYNAFIKPFEDKSTTGQLAKLVELEKAFGLFIDLETGDDTMTAYAAPTKPLVDLTLIVQVMNA